MSKSFVVMFILFVVSVNNAQAVECRTSVQGGDGHWAWRLIDGRRCWYKGASGMDKSLLHWSAAEDGPDRPEDTPEVQPIPPEVIKMLPIMPPQPTFEDRWRLR